MALISAVAGLRQLDAGKYLVPACRLRLGKIRVEAKAEVGAINGGVLEVQGMHRKLLPGLRVGDVLVSQRIEAMIGAYKEILAGDMRGIVKGRLVAYNRLCKGVPGQLNGMLESSPGC
jgi:formylmethanofuran dehydrogenase subunit C